CPAAARSSNFSRLFVLAGSEPRPAPSPRRGEGWGEGVRAIVGIEFVTPSPGGLLPPTSPHWGEVKGGGISAPGVHASSRALPSAAIAASPRGIRARSIQRSGARA